MEPLAYTIRFPERTNHLLDIEARIPTDGKKAIELMMAVWTPGSYLVREYARNVEGLTAATPDGRPCTVEKRTKNRWRITADPPAPTVVVRYRVYARELSVQGNWVDREFALINGAPTFLTRPDALDRPHQVRVEPPAEWSHVISGLASIEENDRPLFQAADYDELVDCPIYAGNAQVHRFEVGGKPHLLVNEGEGGIWDGPGSARDVATIVRTQHEFWGFLPYDRYIFFNLLTETGGGLEHRNSTVLMASRWATRSRPTYLGWLNLVSHEFFHTWNVKRLRPAELGPFDYENEVYTRSLWVAEGITSYYDRLLLRRSGLCTDVEYLTGDPPSSGDANAARGDIEQLQDVPGRLLQPLEQASFDAWIKHYRRDENTPNTAVSYYTKGAVAAFLLDARIRVATDNQKSLDDVMRLAYERFSGDTGFTPEEFRATVQEVAGADLDAWFAHALQSTQELPFDEALGWFGLRFASDSKSDDQAEKGWLGLSTRLDKGLLIVSQVRRDSPAYAAGFNVNDEILAIAEERIAPERWSQRLELFKPGETIDVLVARRARLTRLTATLASEPRRSYRLEIDPEADATAVTRRGNWLGP